MGNASATKQGVEAMKATHFEETLRLRTPRGLNAALQLAARRRLTSPSEWTRQAILAQLESVGVRLRDGEAQEVKPGQ